MIDTKKRDKRQDARDKMHTVRYSLKLQKTTDNDIIQYMEDKPIQATFKNAIRLLIKTETENKQAGE